MKIIDKLADKKHRSSRKRFQRPDKAISQDGLDISLKDFEFNQP